MGEQHVTAATDIYRTLLDDGEPVLMARAGQTLSVRNSPTHGTFLVYSALVNAEFLVQDTEVRL